MQSIAKELKKKGGKKKKKKVREKEEKGERKRRRKKKGREKEEERQALRELGTQPRCEFPKIRPGHHRTMTRPEVCINDHQSVKNSTVAKRLLLIYVTSLVVSTSG